MYFYLQLVGPAEEALGLLHFFFGHEGRQRLTGLLAKTRGEMCSPNAE